ncbi:MAG: sugar transferase, partial [Bifidobacteriaceae bacterium]|nr:sugar transferase [Bifidobacteriaceae bacterium]
MLTDLVLVTASVGATQLLTPVTSGPSVEIAVIRGEVGLPPWVVSLVLVLAWIAALNISGSRKPQVIGTGSAEYQRVLNSTVYTFGLLAILAIMFKMQIARWYLLVAFTFGTVSLMLARHFWRKWLARRRHRGQMMKQAVVFGDVHEARRIIRRVTSEPEAGLEVVGVATPQALPTSILEGRIPLAGGCDEPFGAMDRWGADTLIVVSSRNVSALNLRELTWQAAERRVGLVVAPGLADVEPSRLSTWQVAGLPLVNVRSSGHDKSKRAYKRLFDLAVGGTLTLLLLPVLGLIAVLVKVTSAGPAIYKQSRVGLDGQPFIMYKFRSMRVGADDLLPSLLDQSDGNEVQFKLRNDPRITPFGRFIRRFSIDELPQLFNVLNGTMSLVGPRPHCQYEVDAYDRTARRRLGIKPGITGLWQTGGRSDLSWEDSVRLDVYYVDNWSLMGDLMIL